MLLKQAESAEALAAEIDESRVYPEDWLTFRVTGYSPDTAMPRLIDGATLLSDLSSLVENLTSLAQLTAIEPQASGEPVEALMARWRVTRRTLERYRRAGLVARRVVDDSARGRARLVFSAQAVGAFEGRCAMVGARNGAPASARCLARARPIEGVHDTKRVGAAERAEIVAMWREHRAATGASIDSCAATIAERTGRAKSTVRRVLERAQASPPAPGGDSSPASKGRTTSRDARLALRAQRAGIAMPRVARRLNISVPTVHRIIAVARLEALEAALPASGDHAATQPAEWSSHPLLMQDAEPCCAADLVGPGGAEAKPLSAHDERLLAAAHAALINRARTLVADVDRVCPGAGVIDAAEAALCHALRLKRQLLRSTLPLIRRTLAQHAEASGSDAVMHDAVIHERCLAAVSGAIDDFVPVGTGRLAARVSLALTRALASKTSAGPLRAVRRAVFFGATPTHLTLPPWVVLGLNGLSERERGLIVARFGTPHHPPRTLAVLIESTPGLTPAAWWAVYRKAARLGVV